MGIRIAWEVTTARELCDAIYSLKDTLGPVLEFCTVIDERTSPRAHGFLVELDGNPGNRSPVPAPSPLLTQPNFCPGPDAPSCIQQIQTILAERNEAYALCVKTKRVGAPTVRVVRPGTFREYRDWKIRKSGKGTGMQVKVPVVVLDRETVDWLEERVVDEVKVRV